MTHATDELLVAHLDGELQGTAAGEVAGHVAGCVACRRQLAHLIEASTAVVATLAAVDTFEDRAVTIDITRTDPARVPTTAGPRAWRWAAALVLCAGGVAAALFSERAGPEPRPDAGAVVVQAQPAGGGRIEVAPVSGAMDVALTGVARGTRIEIVFDTVRDVAIEADGTDSPTFRAQRGTVALDLGGAAVRVRIVYPHDLRTGTVRIGGEAIARIANGGLTELRRIEGVTIVAPPAR